MTDNSVAPLAAQPISFAGPTMAFNHFALAMNAAEIIVVCGVSRVSMSVDGSQVTPVPALEWPLTVSMSPIAAKNLHGALTGALTEYKKRFGEIPSDPSAKLVVSEASRNP